MRAARHSSLSTTVHRLCLCWSLGLCALGLKAAPEGLKIEPLAPRSGPRGATLFKVLSPSETGFVTENAYNDPEMWGRLDQEFALGSIGTGVAIGDFDNDGRPDIFVVSKTGQCRLFRNLGNWKFEDVTARAGLADPEPSWVDRAKGLFGAEDHKKVVWKQGAAFVDVNNDGWLDIYVCRFDAPNLLFINQRDGTFKEEAAKRGLAVVDASGMAAFCDYDRDGWLDVYIQTNMLDHTKHPNGQRDYLFHNNGDGTFTNVTDRAGIYGETLVHSATWWDFNGDGWPDLYVSNDFAGPDRLYRNNRDGTFTDVIANVLPHIPYSAMGADLGDVNNDGRVDFLVADMAATTHEKDQRGMATSREMSRGDETSGGPPQYPRNALFLNTGVGHPLEAAELAGLAATDWTWALRWEDLDDDGRLDLFVTNGMSREYQNADLRERAILSDNLQQRTEIMRRSPMLREKHFAYRNLGDLRFDDTSAAWGLDQVGVSFGSAFGDLDGDGDLDLVYSNFDAPATMLRNDEETGHRCVVALRGTHSNRFGIGATVRIETNSGVQVRPLVLARGYLSTSEPIAHFGLGHDTLIRRLSVAWPSGAEQVFTDVPADRRLTITEPSGPEGPPRADPPKSSGQFVDVSERVGLGLPTPDNSVDDPNLQPFVPTIFAHRGPALAAGDLIGDGGVQLLLGATSEASLRVLRPGADGRFSCFTPPPLRPTSSLPDGPVLIFDADGDGANDVLIAKSGTNSPAESRDYEPRLFLNDGHGGFRPAPAGALPDLPISTGALAAADFNRDGRLDLFVGGRVDPGRYPLAPRSALLVNQGGKFEDVTDAIAPGLRRVGMVSSALWTDVDNDGWPDLLLALEWGKVRYFHNEQGRGFVDWTDLADFGAAGTGWWTSLACADFNGDGRLDYVVGNVGLNTRYKASPQRPMLIYYGDFAGSGNPFLVEAYYEGDRLYPWRSRDILATKLPAIRRRYQRNDAYARATLPEIFGQAALDAAQKFAATELRSGVFLSQPDGTYRFEPLPRLAQISALQGIVAGDFDGDGHADIYAVENSYAPIPPVGRFDGGLSQLLRGDGHGHFTAAWPTESGLVVPGDAKALVVTDLDRDGWPDFVITRNNATTLAFRNSGVPGRHEFRVALRGRNGTAAAIGARVVCELSDGSSELAEISAGSGYYSQSPTECFFGYVDSNPPRRLVVRWPDGASSTVPMRGDSRGAVMIIKR